MSVEYDSKATTVALARLQHNPIALDDVDLAQLSLIGLDVAGREKRTAAQVRLMTKATPTTRTAEEIATLKGCGQPAYLPQIPGADDHWRTPEEFRAWGAKNACCAVPVTAWVNLAIGEREKRQACERQIQALQDRVLSLEATAALAKEPVT